MLLKVSHMLDVLQALFDSLTPEKYIKIAQKFYHRVVL